MRILSFVFLCLVAACAPAFAVNIQSIKTPAGVEVWLVEDHTIPIIAMKFSFTPGTTADPVDKEGLTNFLTSMLDEGAGDLNAGAFVAQRDRLGMKMGFEADLDHFTGSFQTLSKNRDAAFALLNLALVQTRFDADAIERMRSQIIVMIEESLQDPGQIARDAWDKSLFGNTPYGRSSTGSVASVRTFTADDLRALQKRLFTRQGLKIVIVGDISRADAERVVDATFATLPDTPPVPVDQPMLEKVAAVVKVVDFNNPQSLILFGGKGLLRSDPDFMAAFVAAHILGDGGFGSRLMSEVRVKRGLTYGIGYGLLPLDHQGLAIGNVSTRNEKAGEVLDTVRKVIDAYGQTGPTAQELEAAKTYLTGSFPLRLDSSGKIADVLLGFMKNNLGTDYVNSRNRKIAALTLEQVKAQAKRLYGQQELVVTIVGKPEGVAATQK